MFPRFRPDILMHSDAFTIVQTLIAYFDHMVYFSCRTLYLLAYEFVRDGC